MEAIHYTTRRNWRKIIKSGSLKPNSPFVKDYLLNSTAMSKSEVHSLRGKNFITAIPKERLIDWKRYGFIGELMRYTSGEVELTFLLENLEGVMVRDHYYTSSEHSEERYGRNVFEEEFDPLGVRLGVYGNACLSLYQEYVLSSKKLSETDLSQIRVPEIWIPFSIPLEKITAKVKPTIIQKVIAQVMKNTPIYDRTDSCSV